MALFASFNLEHHNPMRQIISVPAGQGKSRIMVAIIRVIASRSRAPIATKVQVVYNHSQLLEADRTKIEKICEASNMGVKFTVPSDGVIQMEDKEVVIIDEADHIILDRVIRFKNLRATSMIIGLTATLKEDMLATELEYICGDLGFSYVDSKMDKSIADSTPAVLCSLPRFMGNQLNSMARLLYCSPKHMGRYEFDKLKHEFPDARLLECFENCSDLSILKAMTPGQLYLVSDPALMRGFDYRCSGGIALLICKEFDSSRSLK